MRAKDPVKAHIERARRMAAYERGWVDSLRGYDALSRQAGEDKYDYRQGWERCARYRWRDPSLNGVAEDPTYREPWDPRT